MTMYVYGPQEGFSVVLANTHTPKYHIICLIYTSIVCRVDGLSSNQDGDLCSSELFDGLAPSCPDQPDQPVGARDAYAHAHKQQEEGKGKT